MAANCVWAHLQGDSLFNLQCCYEVWMALVSEVKDVDGSSIQVHGNKKGHKVQVGPCCGLVAMNITYKYNKIDSHHFRMLLFQPYADRSLTTALMLMLSKICMQFWMKRDWRCQTRMTRVYFSRTSRMRRCALVNMHIVFFIANNLLLRIIFSYS